MSTLMSIKFFIDNCRCIFYDKFRINIFILFSVFNNIKISIQRRCFSLFKQLKEKNL